VFVEQASVSCLRGGQLLAEQQARAMLLFIEHVVNDNDIHDPAFFWSDYASPSASAASPHCMIYSDELHFTLRHFQMHWSFEKASHCLPTRGAI
jgi:hypothetical protein